MQPTSAVVKMEPRVVRAVPAPFGGSLAASLAYMAGLHAGRTGTEHRNPYPDWTRQAEAWTRGCRDQRGRQRGA